MSSQSRTCHYLVLYAFIHSNNISKRNEISHDTLWSILAVFSDNGHWLACTSSPFFFTRRSLCLFVTAAVLLCNCWKHYIYYNKPYVSHAHKIMKFQSSISQKLARVVKWMGSMFYYTRTSICTKNPYTFWVINSCFFKLSFGIIAKDSTRMIG